MGKDSVYNVFHADDKIYVLTDQGAKTLKLSQPRSAITMAGTLPE